MAVFLVLVLGITGALELFFYIPTPQQAAASIQVLTYTVPFGGLLRSIHFWAAQLLLVVSALHLVRVVFTGSYAPPRRFNYLLGLGLFVLTVFLDFTGYILRWDQGVQWALVTGTNLVRTIPWMGEWMYALLVGAAQPGAATLVRFYAWHVFMLMLPAVILVVWHAFRVRRDGGIAVPPPVQRRNQERITRYELVRRELVAVLFTAAALFLLSTLIPAPIAPAINEITSAATHTRAPWFFLWVQEMLKWGDPFLWGVLVPVLLLLLLALIPYILSKPKSEEWGSWFPRSNRMAQSVLAAMVIIILILTFLGMR